MAYFVIGETKIVGTAVKLLKTVCFSLVLLVSLIMFCVSWGSTIREQGFVLQAFLILMFFKVNCFIPAGFSTSFIVAS